MKKIISSMLVTGMIFSATIPNVDAFGGTYPQSVGYSPFNEPAIVSQKLGYTPTDEKYLFTVGGKTFILLDTDEEGNYFVMTEETYGRHAFETKVTAHLPLEEAVATNGQYTFTKTGQLKNEDWIFNPQNSTSIAYWLNNTFISNGNGSNNSLPIAIKDHIVEKNWQVEGFKTYFGSGTRLYDNYFNGLGITRFTPSATAASGISLEPYSVRCKLALMSYSEYMAYQNIIGISFAYGTWGGMMLRTQDVFLTANDVASPRRLITYFGPLQVLAGSSDPTKNLKINIADAPNGTSYYFVRPVFWLSKDFFKEVKCDVQSLGIYPMRSIRENSYSDLLGLYTEDELAALGMQWSAGEVGSVRPTATEVSFFGDAASGKKLTGKYIYNKNSEAQDAGLWEFDSSYQWYISKTSNGEKIPIANAFETNYTPTDHQVGQFLWFSVTPRNAFTNNGETVFSKSAVKITSANTINVEFCDSGGNVVTERPADGTLLISVAAQDQNVEAYIVKYDSNRQLIGMQTFNSSDLPLEDYSLALPLGATCKVIILDGLNPYGVYEIK